MSTVSFSRPVSINHFTQRPMVNSSLAGEAPRFNMPDDSFQSQRILFGSDQSPDYSWENEQIQEYARLAGFSQEEITAAHRAGSEGYDATFAQRGPDEAINNYVDRHMGSLQRVNEGKADAFYALLLHGPNDPESQEALRRIPKRTEE